MGSDAGILSWWSRRQAHRERMRRAAGVTSVQLICHRDTWNTVDRWFVDAYGHDERGRVPKDRIRDRGGDLVEVTLSGVSLVGLLLTAQKRGTWNYYEDTRAVARRVYGQVAKVIDAVDPEAIPGHEIPPIVLDDKLGEQAAG